MVWIYSSIYLCICVIGQPVITCSLWYVYVYALTYTHTTTCVHTHTHIFTVLKWITSVLTLQQQGNIKAVQQKVIDSLNQLWRTPNTFAGQSQYAALRHIASKCPAIFRLKRVYAVSNSGYLCVGTRFSRSVVLCFALILMCILFAVIKSSFCINHSQCLLLIIILYWLRCVSYFIIIIIIIITMFSETYDDVIPTICILLQRLVKLTSAHLSLTLPNTQIAKWMAFSIGEGMCIYMCVYVFVCVCVCVRMSLLKLIKPIIVRSICWYNNNHNHNHNIISNK